MKSLKKILLFLFDFIFFVLLFAGLLLYTASKWYAKYYANVSFEQLLYHIYSPTEGMDTGFLDGFSECLTMPLIVTGVVLVTYLLIKFIIRNKDEKITKKVNVILRLFVVVITICSVSYGAMSMYSKMGVDEYISEQNETTELYESYYVNGKDLTFTFPETKRNLIYIYLESMEVTFEDSSNGGLTDTNYISELTTLQNDNVTFNGGDSAYNGYYVLGLNSWTVAGIVGQTSGTPMHVGSAQGLGLTSGDFLPNAYSIGNILEDAGYYQEFICGSDIEFAGRENYLNQHGNYEYLDLQGAKDRGMLAQDYEVWWGYEDAKLFEYTKSELNRVSQNEEPFNITLLTVDTHFPYGYDCQDCENKYDKNYSNVLSCSSKKVSEFVKWCQQQSWYENTTIVIAGDHTTMDTDWFSDKNTDGYNRKAYYTIINSAIEPTREDARTVCTYDLYPTTVAAMGITWEEDRLGFGTNLFGEADTLIEILGYDELDRQTRLHSDYYDYLFNNRDDLFDEEQTIAQPDQTDDYSWQIPTYYDGDVYDYTEYYATPETTDAVAPEGSGDDVPSQDAGSDDTPSGSEGGDDPGTEGGQDNPGTDPGGQTVDPVDPVQPSEPVDPVTPPVVDEGSNISQTE